ncbi:MAG: hypothetical protein ACYCX3_08170 [Thermoleophilia bacterium]
MADKKVDRNVRSSDQERPQTPTQKMTGALSDSGNVNVAEADRDKGKTALLDRFRDRDERYRRDQALAAAESVAPAPETTSESVAPAPETTVLDAPAQEDEEDDVPAG